MRLALALALLFAPIPPQRTLYVLGWSSPVAVQLTGIEIQGGALVQVLTDGSGQSGTIGATAERACLTITAWGQDTRGGGVRFVRAWDEGCSKVYAPMVGGATIHSQDGASAPVNEPARAWGDGRQHAS